MTANNDTPLLGDTLPVIGLMAADRAGKDTVANVLVEQGWAKFAFADALKEAIYVLNPRVAVGYNSFFLQDLLDDNGEEWVKEHSPEYREMLIRFGTETLREHLGFQYIWIDKLLQRISSADKWVIPPKGIVITDVRDPLEVTAVTEELGGYIIELRSSRGAGHYASDEQLDEMRQRVSYVITNDSSLEDLHREALMLEGLILKEYEVEQDV